MIWIPLIAACLLALCLGAVHLWHERSQRNTARVYRARFIQLVSQLDSITIVVNNLGGHASRVKDSKVLDYYESNLRILETLLMSIKRLPPFGSVPGHLDPAFALAKDLRDRVQRTQRAFRSALLGKEVKLQELVGAVGASSGCYFCSRPMISNRFSKVKVKIDGDVKDVVSCKICRSELETTKKVKVLYFMKNERPVHWSEVTDYVPSEDFWSINKRKPVRKETRLELVHSDNTRDR